MIVEEKAEKYADKNNDIIDFDNDIIDFDNDIIDFDNDIIDYSNVKKAYLAGLKAGRSKWHKLTLCLLKISHC